MATLPSSVISAASSSSVSGGTSASGSGRTPDVGNWIRGCFLVTVGTDYKTYKEVLAYSEQDPEYGGTNAKPEINPNVKKIMSDNNKEDSPLPVYFSRRKCRDSSLGGNDAINPLPQYSLDDDIQHPHLLVGDGGWMGNTEVGMGQVYSEHHDDLQQILYLGFGIPVFNNVGSFWATATDMDMAGLMNKGSTISIEKIGYLIGSTPNRIFQIATIPYKFITATLDRVQNTPISKYYSFQSHMPMYFKFVNTILVMLATNMNIVGSAEDINTTGANAGEGGTTSLITNEDGTGSNSIVEAAGLPGWYKAFGLDMAKIMTKKFLYEGGAKGQGVASVLTDQAFRNAIDANGGVGNVDSDAESRAEGTTTREAVDSSTTNENGETSYPGRNWLTEWVNSFKTSYSGTIYDSHLFIGFRIDKGMGGSESFSNSTGESKIAQLMNEKYQAGQDASFQASLSGDSGGVADFLSSAVGLVQGLIKGVTSGFKLDPLGAAMTGAAKINIPEVWMNSSWSRTASFSITCLAPYGDLESIFQSEYVPLACILAGSLPRGTGHSSHSAPFVCQAYCRGIFSSPLCMIESLEVTRGADQFGMTAGRLPLKLTMHVTLKDLSPVMHMTMGGDRGLFNAIMGTDDNFAEYMMTLSGMGLRDRLMPFRAIRRKISILLGTVYKNTLSPYMLSMEFGSRNSISRFISLIKSGGGGLSGN